MPSLGEMARRHRAKEDEKVCQPRVLGEAGPEFW